MESLEGTYEQFTQHGAGSSFSFFTILIYLLGMVGAGYLAWVKTAGKSNAVRAGIVTGAVFGAWLLIYLLRALTINL